MVVSAQTRYRTCSAKPGRGAVTGVKRTPAHLQARKHEDAARHRSSSPRSRHFSTLAGGSPGAQSRISAGSSGACPLGARPAHPRSRAPRNAQRQRSPAHSRRRARGPSPTHQRSGLAELAPAARAGHLCGPHSQVAVHCTRLVVPHCPQLLRSPEKPIPSQPLLPLRSTSSGFRHAVDMSAQG